MSLVSAIFNAFQRQGIINRDFDNRLKGLEKRTAINYPKVAEVESSNELPPGYDIKRSDGTLAVTIRYTTTQNMYAVPGSSPDDALLAVVTTIYKPDGVTVLEQTTSTVTSSTASGRITGI